MDAIGQTIVHACSNFTFKDAWGTFTNSFKGSACGFAGALTAGAVSWAGHAVLKQVNLENNFAALTAVKVAAFVAGAGVTFYLAPQFGVVAFAAEKMIPGAIISLLGVGSTSFVLTGAAIGYFGKPALIALGIIGTLGGITSSEKFIGLLNASPSPKQPTAANV